MMWFYIFEGFIGVAVVFCLVMALASGPFPADIKKTEAAKQKKRKRKHGYSYEEYRKIVMS